MYPIIFQRLHKSFSSAPCLSVAPCETLFLIRFPMQIVNVESRAIPIPYCFPTPDDGVGAGTGCSSSAWAFSQFLTLTLASLKIRS